MGSAFVVTNPLLPPEYFNSAGVDKLVLEMNKEVPHSLLECPGKVHASKWPRSPARRHRSAERFATRRTQRK